MQQRNADTPVRNGRGSRDLQADRTETSLRERVDKNLHASADALMLHAPRSLIRERSIDSHGCHCATV